MLCTKTCALTALSLAVFLLHLLPAHGHAGISNKRQGSSTVTFTLASGCFWGRQHDVIEGFEIARLNRTAGKQITTVGGYAGGHSSHDVSCYYNSKNASVYSTQGHAEAISVEVPVAGLRGHAAALFDLYFLRFFIEFDEGVFVREDAFDQGPGYRWVVLGVGLWVQRGVCESGRERESEREKERGRERERERETTVIDQNPSRDQSSPSILLTLNPPHPTARLSRFPKALTTRCWSRNCASPTRGRVGI